MLSAFVWWLGQVHSSLQSQLWAEIWVCNASQSWKKYSFALSKPPQKWIALGHSFRYSLSSCEAEQYSSAVRQDVKFPPSHLLLGHSLVLWVTGAWMHQKKSGKYKCSADVVEITQTHCDTWITSRHTLRLGLCTIVVTALFLPAREPHHSGAFHSCIFLLIYLYLYAIPFPFLLKSSAVVTSCSSARLSCMANGVNLCLKGQVREDYGLLYCWMADLISTNVPLQSMLSPPH